MSLFTEKMKMLTAVVLDERADQVVKALLEEGAMDFVKVSDFQGERAAKLMERAPEVPRSAIGDLRARCENLMRQGGIAIPAIGKEELDNAGKLDADRCRKTLDRLTASLSELRDKQKNLNQRLLGMDEVLGYAREKKMEYLEVHRGDMAQGSGDDLQARIAQYTAVVAEDGGHLAVLNLRRDSSRVSPVLDKFGWTEVPGAEKDALEACLKVLQARRDQVAAESADTASKVEGKIKERAEELRGMWITLRVSELSGRVESYFSYTRNTTIFSGWVPARKAEEVGSVIYEASKGQCIIEWTDDSRFDRSEVPSSVSSPAAFAPFERLVRNYGTPEYGSVNPTPFTTVAYILMFMLMFADLGQGFVLLLIGILGKSYYKKHPMAKDGLISRYLCSLLVYLGPASMAGGLLFGSCFGYSPIPAIWFNYHSVVNGHAEGGLVTSVYDILGITIKFGIAVIWVGLVLNWVNLWRKRRFIELVFDKYGLVGGAMYALGIYACFYFVGSDYSAFPPDVWLYVGIGICLVLLLVKGPVEAAHHAKLSGHKAKASKVVMDTVMDFLVSVLEIFSGYLSNTLSFMRVAGLGIAHVSLMTAFMDMAEMTGNIVFEILIMILGNVLVIAIEGLSAGIQSLRLNYYEFFTKFFTGRGFDYKPIGLKSAAQAD